MRLKKLPALFILFIPFLVHSQGKINLGRPATDPLSNEQSPSITADGKLLLFVSDYGEKYTYPVTSKRVGNNWTKPEEVTGILNKLTNDGGFSFTPDGNGIYFHSSRYGGVGNSDIWFASRNGEKFLPPVNLAKPVNTTGLEMDPFLSIDGKRLFFVRASGSKKTSTGQDCGTIYYTDKTTSSWKDPVALPSPVTSGCECSPRLLSDNRTLIFASERPGGKGGLDLYKSVLTNGKWSAPKPLEFINTSGDDRYVAIAADGEEIIFTDVVNEKNDLFRMKLPEEFRPLKTAFVKGTVKAADSKKPMTVKVIVKKLSDGSEIEKIYNNASDGKFELVLTEKEKLDISIIPFTKGYSYYTKQIELGAEEKTLVINEEILLLPLKKGTSFSLDYVMLDPDGKVSKDSREEMDRLTTLLKENPSVSVEIAAHLDKIIMDSVQREGLTEVITDTIRTVEIVRDSVEQMIDSVMAMVEVTDTIIHTTVKYTYHNDRTQKEAEEIRNYLMRKGIPENRLIAVGYGDKRKKGKRSFEMIVR